MSNIPGAGNQGTIRPNNRRVRSLSEGNNLQEGPLALPILRSGGRETIPVTPPRTLKALKLGIILSSIASVAALFCIFAVPVMPFLSIPIALGLLFLFIALVMTLILFRKNNNDKDILMRKINIDEWKMVEREKDFQRQREEEKTAYESIIFSYSQQQKYLKDDRKNLQNDFNVLDQVKKDQEDLIKNLKLQIQSLDSELSIKKHEKESAEKDRKEARKQKDEVESFLKHTQQAFEISKESLEKNKKNFQETKELLLEKTKELEELKKNLLDKQTLETARRVKDLQVDLSEKTKEIREKDEEVEKLKKNLSEKIKECKEKEEAIKEKQGALSASQTAIKSLAIENKKYQKKHKESPPQSKLSQIKNEGDQTKEDVRNAFEFLELEKELDELKEIILNLKALIEKMEDDNETDKQALKLSIETEKKLKIKEAQLSGEVEYLTDKSSLQEKIILDQEKEIQQSRKRINSLIETQFKNNDSEREQEAEIEKLQEELLKLQIFYETLEGNMEHSENQIRELQEALIASEYEIADRDLERNEDRSQNRTQRAKSRTGYTQSFVRNVDDMFGALVNENSERNTKIKRKKNKNQRFKRFTDLRKKALVLQRKAQKTEKENKELRGVLHSLTSAIQDNLMSDYSESFMESSPGSSFSDSLFSGNDEEEDESLSLNIDPISRTAMSEIDKTNTISNTLVQFLLSTPVNIPLISTPNFDIRVDLELDAESSDQEDELNQGNIEASTMPEAEEGNKKNQP